MTPEKLQTEVWGAYARFYSFRQWLKYLATFRYGTMALYSWYWVFLRRWRKENGQPRLPRDAEAASLGGAPAICG